MITTTLVLFASPIGYGWATADGGHRIRGMSSAGAVHARRIRAAPHPSTTMRGGGAVTSCVIMGITFNREDLQIIDGVLTLIACELYEVSIVAIPSNANAVRLYAENGELMKEEEIKTLCLSITPTEEKFNLNQMKKIILSMATLMALGFKDNPTDGHDASDVEAKVLGLSQSVIALTAENETLKLAAKNAKDAQEAAAKTRITTKVELGITQGKFGVDKKEDMITLGLASETALDTVIGSIPAKANFSAGVTVPAGNGTLQVATMEEFQKLSIEAQLSFKNDSPEGYKKLFS